MNPLRWLLCWLSLLGVFCTTTAAPTLSLLPESTSEGDLEVAGSMAGQPSRGFIPRQQLLALPQINVTNQNDVELQCPVVYSGVPLEQILSLLAADSSCDLVMAVCRDKYASVFPREFILRHHPLLVLKLDDKDYLDWPKTTFGARMSPYYIAYHHFTPDPARTVDGVVEEPKIPFSVIRLELLRSSETISRLQLSGAEGPPLSGQTIALRECLPCHYSGPLGGRFSGKPWLVLAAWAQAEPDLFQKYIRNPRQVEPTSRMPGFPAFQSEALVGLQAYFSDYLKQSVTQSSK